MINVTKNTKEIKGRIMSDEMQKIIEECYQYFSKFQVPNKLELCPCCLSPDSIKYKNLLNQPLKDILPIDIYFYIDAIRDIDDHDRTEIPYFLPRILELIANDENVAMCMELYLGKLRQVDPYVIDDQMLILLNRFALQFWKDLFFLKANRLRSSSLDEVLLMFSIGTLNIMPLLGYLTSVTEFFGISAIADFIFDQRDNGKLTNAFVGDSLDINDQVNQWLQNNAKTLSNNAQIAVLNMPDLAWQNKTKIDYLRDEYLLAMCDENVILATLPSDS